VTNSCVYCISRGSLSCWGVQGGSKLDRDQAKTIFQAFTCLPSGLVRLAATWRAREPARERAIQSVPTQRCHSSTDHSLVNTAPSPHQSTNPELPQPHWLPVQRRVELFKMAAVIEILHGHDAATSCKNLVNFGAVTRKL